MEKGSALIVVLQAIYDFPDNKLIQAARHTVEFLTEFCYYLPLEQRPMFVLERDEYEVVLEQKHKGL